MQWKQSWWSLLLLCFMALPLVGCGASAAAYTKVEPYELIKNDDGINTVILTEKAMERLQMASAAVTEEALNGDARLVVPYHALIYDNDGGTWVYTNPEERTYKRAAVTVEHIEGNKVYLTDGPAVGTQVAIASVAELYGTDTGVGK
ncbi:MAG: hypothetical protein KDE19_18980 [Caldilineaceae bacterium]|nr:hypothetical protein [Caldilineaceae bacterium]